MSKRIDLTGKKFGRWTVVKFAKYENNRTLWECKCDCGTVKILDGHALKTNHSLSCGCLNIEKLKERYIDLEGQKFGKWTVIEKRPNKNNKIMWLCKCECGTEREVTSSQLLCGKSTSCGCKRIETIKKKYTTHNKSKTRIYEIYCGILKRCFNKKHHTYVRYGGKGISVCEEWLGENGFENFYNWAINNGYSEDLTIDRYPNRNGDYSPTNCRWATAKQQCNNRSTNVFITRDGITHTMSEWCDILEMPYSIVNRRRQKGWSEDKLFLPIKRKGNKENVEN